MNLVSYSESDGSDDEEQIRQQTRKRPASSGPKSQPDTKFTIDKSNPKKIRINLNDTWLDEKDVSDNNKVPAQEPALGRQRPAGETGGFNAMLPAPKRTNDPSSVNGFKPRGGGPLGRGVSLKTGAEPGFSRESDAELKDLLAKGSSPQQVSDLNPQLREPEQMDGDSATAETNSALPPIAKATTSEWKPRSFKPLSVARDTKKKKKKPPIAAESTVPATTSSAIQSNPHSELSNPKSTAQPAPKLELFSMGNQVDDEMGEVTAYSKNLTTNPSLTIEENVTEESMDVDTDYNTTPYEQQPYLTIDSNPSLHISSEENQESSTAHQSLTSIADDLNLSASARRQLLGRPTTNNQRKNNTTSSTTVATATTTTTIKNFNTDLEYSINNQSLLNPTNNNNQNQQQHNPVRAIAPGKHSLKQLVSAATGQKEALEESFAQGRRNKNEGRGRYGW